MSAATAFALKKKVRGKPLSVRELYALIVGEAGIDPNYFLRAMTSDEAADFLEGYRRRDRVAWEIARIGWWLQVADRDKTIMERFPLEWDPQPKRKRTTRKEQDALRQRAAEFAKIMNNGKE